MNGPCPAGPGSHADLRIVSARGWWQRASGLLFRAKLLPGQALWIHNCRAVHTVGMRYSLSVFFLDSGGRVLRVVPRLPPLGFATCRRASSVLEMLAISEHDIDALSVVVERAVGRAPGSGLDLFFGDGVLLKHRHIAGIEAAVQDPSGDDVDGYLEGCRHIFRDADQGQERHR